MKGRFFATILAVVAVLFAVTGISSAQSKPNVVILATGGTIAGSLIIRQKIVTLQTKRLYEQIRNHINRR